MKTFLTLIFCAVGLTVFAQKAPKCEDSYKAFEGKFLAKDYNDAYTVLSDLRVRCPKVNENLFVYGEAILKYRVEVSQTPEDAKANVADLIALYGEQLSNYPMSGADVKKTQLQMEHGLITKPDAYKAFTASFNTNRNAFTDYKSLLAYYDLVLEDFKSGKGINDDQYFQKYADISAQVAYAEDNITARQKDILKKKETSTLTDEETQFITDAPLTIEALGNVADVIRKQSRDYVTCEKMEAYYEKNYEAHKTDVAWLSSLADAMFGKKCYSSTLLKKAVLAIHTVKPTKETSFRLGILTFKNGDNKEAVKYFEQAIMLETSQVKKSDICMQMASLSQSDRAAQKQYLLRAVELDPKAGQAFLKLAQMYATVQPNDECKLTDFDRKTLNFLAIDMAKKAQAAEPRYKMAAETAIAGYTKNLPTKQEAKVLKKKKGDTVTFGCWINETVTLPNL
ncbi:hypothetical protein R1T16_11040 [Flavobacterium sp. DG1-102-2]|uniref:hypothetical protein n=1 Tax=Flavobacterium sp. DG1-102-2 TaxID=3081663 RepID=UPI00294A510B|nr:hypothetical protein [Flavobacterium sp. DG1-102-2]MDV6168964.1 hypothetical protein [Flavobacterium sp. DG1-102-2]